MHHRAVFIEFSGQFPRTLDPGPLDTTPNSTQIIININQFSISGCDSWFGQKFVKCGPTCVPEVLQNLNKCDILENAIEDDDTKNEKRDLDDDVRFLNLGSSEIKWFITSMGLIFVILILVVGNLAYCLKR